MSETKVDLKGAHGLSQQALEEAKASLAKLPILGPIVWLYGRDAVRRHTFIADLDWLVLPPIVLDQCKVYFKGGIPFGFASWARVSDAVHERLRSRVPKLAPHEWRSGEHAWIVEAISPFGAPTELIDDIRRTVFGGVKVNRIAAAPDGKAIVEEFPALAEVSATKH